MALSGSSHKWELLSYEKNPVAPMASMNQPEVFPWGTNLWNLTIDCDTILEKPEATRLKLTRVINLPYKKSGIINQLAALQAMV